VRAQAVSGLHRAGNVYDPDPTIHTWANITREERKTFPRAKNDDTVDSMSQALTYLVEQFRAFGEAMAALKEDKSLLHALFGVS
jgi:phage terminase large subunit-like protein